MDGAYDLRLCACLSCRRSGACRGTRDAASGPGSGARAVHTGRTAQIRSILEGSPRIKAEREAIQRRASAARARSFGPRGRASRGLRSGAEALSGVRLDHVRVRRNSSRPAEIGAVAFARGDTIHLAPGQERHLPHEAWRVAQQAQGRVRPTTQAMGVPLNDDPALEREADTMGARAIGARP